MAEAQNVPTGGGFNVPPAGGAPVGLPSSANQQAGFVPPAAPPAAPPAQGFDQAHVDAQVALAVAAARATPAPAAATPIAPAAEASTDALLDTFTESFAAIGAGVDQERAFGKALLNGRADLIDLAYIAEKGGANAGRLATIAKAIVERVQGKANEAKDAVHAASGGADAWNAASAAFNQNAEPHVKQVVIKMLESGSKDTVLAASKMVMDFAQNGGLVVKPAGMLQAGVAGGNPAQALDKEGFIAATRALDKSSSTYNTQYDALVARRRQGKLLGR